MKIVEIVALKEYECYSATNTRDTYRALQGANNGLMIFIFWNLYYPSDRFETRTCYSRVYLTIREERNRTHQILRSFNDEMVIVTQEHPVKNSKVFVLEVDFVGHSILLWRLWNNFEFSDQNICDYFKL